MAHCQDYYQLVRLLGFEDFEDKTPSNVTIGKSQPIVAAQANVEHVLKLLQCAVGKATMKMPDPAEFPKYLLALAEQTLSTLQ